MKKLTAMVMCGFFCIVDVYASATIDLDTFDKRAQNVKSAGPHVYDGYMAAWTKELGVIFKGFFSGAELKDTQAIHQDLKEIASHMEGAPQYGGTWSNVVQQRLAGDLHPELLRMLTYFYHTPEDKRTLIQSMVPLNPSMSAVYNVFFVLLVRDLQLHETREKAYALELEETIKHTFVSQEASVSASAESQIPSIGKTIEELENKISSVDAELTGLQRLLPLNPSPYAIEQWNVSHGVKATELTMFLIAFQEELSGWITAQKALQ